jgi:hypothetical protein
MNRREVLASGFALSLLAPCIAMSRVAPERRGQRQALRYFVAEGRDATAFAAAEAAAAQGAAVILAGTDLTPLYFALDDLWQKAPVAVAGVTTVGTAFALERLALDHGLRVAYRGERRDADWLRTAYDHPRALRSLAAPRSAADRAALVSWLFAPKHA